MEVKVGTMDNKTIQSMINKCEIFYDDLLISAEEIIKNI